MLANILKSIFTYLCPQAVSLSPAASAVTPVGQQAYTLSQNGAMMDNGAIVGAFQALANNSAPNGGGCKFATSAATSITLTDIVGLTQRLTAGQACTVTIDNAPNILQTIPGAYNGMTFPLTIVTNAATTVATPTVTTAGGSGGITLSGTTAVLAASGRWYQGQITQLYSSTGYTLTSGTTFTSIAQIGSTNMYTLTIGTNAVTLAAGNLVYIGTTAGTLPAGWYPVYTTVAHATVIVIATPPSAAAWTCTAASMVQPTTVPSTLAPTITITGMYSTVVNTLAV